MKKNDLLQQCAAFEKIAFDTMSASTVLPLREPGYIYYHGLRVAKLCLELAKVAGVKGVNQHLLYAAGLFHDVAKGKEQHALAGADLMPHLLSGTCQEGDIAEIARLVAGHNARSLPNRNRKDVRILQDADTLDHFGAQSIWLGSYFSAHSGRAQPEMLAYYRSADFIAYADRCERCLSFEASRKELRQRIRYQQAFLKRLTEALPPAAFVVESASPPAEGTS